MKTILLIEPTKRTRYEMPDDVYDRVIRLMYAQTYLYRMRPSLKRALQTIGDYVPDDAKLIKTTPNV